NSDSRDNWKTCPVGCYHYVERTLIGFENEVSEIEAFGIEAEYETETDIEAGIEAQYETETDAEAGIGLETATDAKIRLLLELG
ncbi:hypothetical protein BGX26_006142, partial [Mortierella sp. AD094]